MSELERGLLGQKVTERQRTIYGPRGCKKCDNTGYRGRIALMELLHIDPDIDELMARRATPREIQKLAMSKGFRPLAEVGAARVMEGVTSIDEVSRVVDLTSKLKQS